MTDTDTRERLQLAIEQLRQLRDCLDSVADRVERVRLAGKAEGVKLALSYLDEEARLAPDDPATESARVYTGEFPDGGPFTVDGLVVDLVESVKRCRLKYAAACRRSAEAQGILVEEVLAEVESSYRLI